MFADLNIDIESKLDKGYRMENEEILSLSKGENAEKRKVALAYVNYKMYHDPAFIQSENFADLYQILYQRLKATINAFIKEFDNDKDKIQACYQEFMMASSILCNLTGLEEYSEELFDREETSRLVLEFFQYLNASDSAVCRINLAQR